MSNKTNIKIIIKTIEETLGLKKGSISEKSKSVNYENWDSLGQLKLINNIESKFNIVFTMEEIFQIMTVADIYNIMDKKIK